MLHGLSGTSVGSYRAPWGERSRGSTGLHRREGHDGLPQWLVHEVHLKRAPPQWCVILSG